MGNRKSETKGLFRGTEILLGLSALGPSHETRRSAISLGDCTECVLPSYIQTRVSDGKCHDTILYKLTLHEKIIFNSLLKVPSTQSAMDWNVACTSSCYHI